MLLLALLGAVLWSAAVLSAAAADVVEANLEVVASSDLGGPGRFGPVAVVGTTAMVAVDGPEAQPSCAGATVKVVDVKDPERPAVVADLELPTGRSATDVAAVAVATEAFAGDLVAVALGPLVGPEGPCPAPNVDDVAYFDVTDPAAPRALGGTDRCPTCPLGSEAVSLAQRGDGRVLSVRAAAGTVVVEDAGSHEGRTELARWPAPGPSPGADGCAATPWVRDVELQDDGQGALVVLGDGRVHHLDLSDAAAPAGAEGTGPTAGSVAAFAAVVPVGALTLGIVAEEGCTDGPDARGLRVFELEPGTTPVEREPVHFPGGSGPGRLVASGELAYVAWHGQGVRVLDMGQVRPRVVAQFIPPAGDVVGVGLLPDHVVVTDRTSGLYVLERPEEAGDEPAFWSQFLGILPYLGFAGVLAASFLVPRLAMGRARAGSGAGSPVPSGVPRRPA